MSWGRTDCKWFANKEQPCKPTPLTCTKNGCEYYEPLFIQCPFCNESDFDLAGLKTHLLHGDCDIFNNTETFKRLF